MAISRTHRVPILLLALLTGTLLFPRACDSVRLGVGARLPATVPPTDATVTELPREREAVLAKRLTLLEQQQAARPSGDAALAGLRVQSRRASAAPVAVAARVLHVEVSSARRTFVIDAGQDDGVVPGLPVIQSDSLIGVVVTASARAARVLRIDDRAAATTFPAAVLTSEADAASPLRGQGVSRGTGDGLLRVSFLGADGARVGDLVVTNAGSRMVPEGLVLGEVIEMSDEERDGSFEAVVRPLRDLETIASVLVLRVEPTGLRVESK
ncbi:MAG: hypothetical protein K8T90_01820 [Planctomycetes bacterium]|nr:hypothetical protein [Planctomycetota bacterium]